jgi:two-component system response regulator HydG
MTERAKRVVIVDDDEDLRNLVNDHLTSEGFEVMAFKDPADVLAVASRKPEFWMQTDLVVTDLNMPQIGGIEFIKKLQSLPGQLPVIVLTNSNTVEHAVEAIKAGAYDFLLKPINFNQLLVSMRRALTMTSLQTQNRVLRSTLKSPKHFEGLVSKSPKMIAVIDLAKRVAQSCANVVIYGESGSGKELIAKAIHANGPRCDAPFIAINCSAIPETLLESELFGHAKGAFTGALDKKHGLFEEAEGGTLFLDEIGDLQLSLQSKLLRVLQERVIRRVGENTERPINVRVLAASHKILKSEVEQGRFREDLYFRLNVIEVAIPPLRERKEDIIPLAEHFFEKFLAQNPQASVKGFSQLALEHLLSSNWPGNVRSLENAIERAVILGRGSLIDVCDLPALDENSEVNCSSNAGLLKSVLTHTKDSLPSLDEFCKTYVTYVLGEVGGVKEKAARLLEIDRKTLYRKLSDDTDHLPRNATIAPAHSP